MPKEFSFRTQNVIITGLVIAVAVPLLLAYLVHRQSSQADDAYHWVEHTHEVLSSLDELRSTVRQAESEQRAYLLTHDGTYADRYRLAAKWASEVLSRIERMVKSYPIQASAVAALRPMLQERLDALERNLGLIVPPLKDQMVLRLADGAAKTVKLEMHIADLAKMERAHLEERRQGYQELRNAIELRAVAATGVGALLLVAIGIVLMRENRRRMDYQERIAEARDAALDAVDATSSFVASVSHEIRTPMNGIIGSADLLLRDPELSPKQRTGLETINLSAHSLLGLMNDLLDLSKVRAGQMTFGKDDFCPAEVVEEVVMLFASAAAKKGIELAHTVAANVPPAVRGDRLRLRQILVNLVSNAVKFTEIGGVSVYLVRRVELEREGHVCLRFDIRDTGPGISKEAQEHLFKPFSQVDSKLARRHGGTGLGLAISKELVQRMNGALGVESLPDHGATFWFAVDFEKSEISDIPAALSLEGRRVLVVECRPLTAEAIRGHLEAWGMTPWMVTKAEDAPASAPPGWETGTENVAIVFGASVSQDFANAIAQLRERVWLAEAPVYLIKDEGISDAMAREVNPAAVLNYPLRPSQLYDVLSGTSRDKSRPMMMDHPALPSATIIVADDNPINQQVISNQLDHLGMRSVTSSNGLEAIGLVRDGAGQLVLMDCQMPEMDGFEATRLIREWEQANGRKRIPIIAVTANVMAGDAEQCLRAGMDGYLAKPVEFNALYQTLERWLESARTSGPTKSTPHLSQKPDGTNPVLNQRQLSDCLSGDTEMDLQLLKGALKQADEEIDKMAAAISVEGGDGWERSAHRGRGSTSMMGFTGVAAVFEEAEFRAPHRASKAVCIEKLRSAMQTLKAHVREIGFDA